MSTIRTCGVWRWALCSALLLLLAACSEPQSDISTGGDESADDKPIVGSSVEPAQVVLEPGVEPAAEPAAEPSQVSEPAAQPVASPAAEPQPQPAAQPAPQPVAEPEPEPEPEIICEPGEKKPDCEVPDAVMVCNALGTAFVEVDCPGSQTCYLGECLEYDCPPGVSVCAGLNDVVSCVSDDGGDSYAWVKQHTCTNMCIGGQCATSCDYDQKSGFLHDCEWWELNYTSNGAGPCTDTKLMVVPSSAASMLAVYDLNTVPPTLHQDSPFATCANPSRILMEPSTDIYASCRDDGNVWKHDLSGAVLWKAQLEGCFAARGIARSASRLFAACSANGVIYELNTATGETLQQLDTGGEYLYGLAADASGLYVVNTGFFAFGGAGGGGWSVRKYHLGGPDEFEVAWEDVAQPYSLALSPLGILWVTNGASLRGLSTQDGSVVKTVTTPGMATGIAVALDGTVWAGINQNNSVVRLDLNDELESFGLPGGDVMPHGVVVDAEGTAYSINMTSSTLTRFDSVTGEGTTFAQGELVMPYGYSGDMTAISGCIANTQDYWSSPVIKPGGEVVLEYVTWEEVTPPGTAVQASYKLDDGDWIPTGNGEEIKLPATSFQVRLDLDFEEGGEAPLVEKLAVMYSTGP